MRIVVFSADPAVALKLPPRARCSIETLPLYDLPGFEALPDDVAYLSCADLEPAAFRKQLNRLRAKCAAMPWGVIDPEGSVEDPAALFHEGASDYLGPGVLDADCLDTARFKRLRDYSNRTGSSAAETARPGPTAPAEQAEAFPGWRKLKAGETRSFHFLYAGPTDAAALKTKIGERRYSALRERLKNQLSQVFSPADAIVWMQTDSYFLFLLPPEEAHARLIVEACVRLLLNLPLLSAQHFGLETPLQLVFALHRGTTPFQVPGSTGTVVSEDVNFIHHLGMKKAEAGSLSVSADAASALPPLFTDLFVDAGSFEGKNLLRSRRFL
ncbi:MAG TPA: hypothetical protein DIC34_06270 [Treponema sp.]|nr:MAG: hypothetical protein A2Y36_16195 [Treponema sp. GWA1_62_8]OHE68274.1 MAG: hypothetical protein A2001_16670 [Treponema sp. GWC1_61_84]HCM26141.1 hypothetical protein [Treponema sp.]